MSLLCPGCLGQFSFLQYSNAKMQSFFRCSWFCRSKLKFTKHHLNSTQTYIPTAYLITEPTTICCFSPHLVSPPWWPWLTGRMIDSWVGSVSHQQVVLKFDPGPQRILQSPDLKKCVKVSVLSVDFTSLNEGFKPTSVLSPLILWKLLWPLIPNVIKLWTKLVQYCHLSNQVVGIKD